MIGIYKITNKANNKIYIGQSIHIEKRWSEHRSYYMDTNTPLYNAIQKYGLNNFNFEVIEECAVSELDNKEIYYINYYNSQVPNGYNIQRGGSDCRLVPNDQILNIINLIKNSTLTFVQIAEQTGYDYRNLFKINSGELWTLDNETYPLREPREPILDQCYRETICECGKPKSKGSRHCMECSHKFLQKVERPSRDELLKLVALSGFKQVGEQYGVTDNSIKKWCKAYGLPTYKKEIVALYNTEQGIVQEQKIKKDYTVGQYRIDTMELVAVFSSPAEAARSLGKNSSHITEVCNGILTSAYGYIWKYINRE